MWLCPRHPTLLAKPWSLPYSAVLFCISKLPLLMLTSALTLYPYLLYLTALNGLHVYQTKGQTWPVDQGLKPLDCGFDSALLFSIPITAPHITATPQSALNKLLGTTADGIRHPTPISAHRMSSGKYNISQVSGSTQGHPNLPTYHPYSCPLRQGLVHCQRVFFLIREW